MNRPPHFAGDEPGDALLADDTLCRELLDGWRDSVIDMFDAVARWVLQGGANWNKPTKFGIVTHEY